MKSLSVLVCMFSLFFLSCRSKDKKETKPSEKYEQSKETLAETEKKNPNLFLSVSGHDKRNLLGQTVVKGTLTNSAKICSFKDISIELAFYSKTGALLEKDIETIYETLEPGSSKNFKTKYFAPKGTDSVALKVLSAKI
jgi:hypothetical protein